MLRLILFRHAEAERGQGVRDHERRLEPSGRADVGKVGAYLAHHRLLPDLALVSDAQRARETWEFASAEQRPALVSETEGRLYDASAEEILGVIHAVAPRVRTLLVLGHNPGLHELARILIAAGDVEQREQLNEELPTSALVVIEFAVEDWSKVHRQSGRLARFIVPRAIGAATD